MCEQGNASAQSRRLMSPTGITKNEADGVRRPARATYHAFCRKRDERTVSESASGH